MKTSKKVKLPINYCIGIFFSCALFFSCSKESAKNMKQNYSETEYFKGIFFASGPVADIIPELSEFRIENFINDESSLNSINSMHNNIISVFDAENPGFLNDFKNVVTGGNPIDIQAKINDGSIKLRKTLETYYQNEKSSVSTLDLLMIQEDFKNSLELSNIDKNDHKAIANFVNEYMTTKVNAREACVVKVVVLVAAGAVALAVVVWSVAAVVEGVWLWAGEVKSTNYWSTPLFQDKLINSIAVQLNPTSI